MYEGNGWNGSSMVTLISVGTSNLIWILANMVWEHLPHLFFREQMHPTMLILLDAVIADYKGQPQVIPNAVACLNVMQDLNINVTGNFGNQGCE